MNRINLLLFCAVCFSSLFTNLEVTLFKDPRAFVCKYLFIKNTPTGNVNKDHEPLPCFSFQNLMWFCASPFSLLRVYDSGWLVAAALCSSMVLEHTGGLPEESQSSEAEVIPRDR